MCPSLKSAVGPLNPACAQTSKFLLTECVSISGPHNPLTSHCSHLPVVFSESSPIPSCPSCCILVSHCCPMKQEASDHHHSKSMPIDLKKSCCCMIQKMFPCHSHMKSGSVHRLFLLVCCTIQLLTFPFTLACTSCSWMFLLVLSFFHFWETAHGIGIPALPWICHGL